MTSMAAALKAAGYETGQDKLRRAADAAIAAHPREWDAAWSAFRAAVWADRDMLAAAFQRYEEAALRPYLYTAAQKQHRAGKPRVVSGGGRDNGATRPGVAPTRPDLKTVIDAERRTLLDTFMVNGQPLGDVSAAVARSWGVARGREARFVGIITSGIAPNDHRPMREIVTAEEADQAFKRAGEIGNE